jgi:hypothetical protein
MALNALLLCPIVIRRGFEAKRSVPILVSGLHAAGIVLYLIWLGKPYI